MNTNQKTEEKLKDISSEQKQEILDNFQGFMDYLKKQINRGEKLGLNEEQLAKAAEKVAEHLNKHEEPQNREEYVLNKMWNVAKDDEKHAIAHVLVRLAKEEGNV
ncbi:MULTISPECIES: DUF3243 family protein [Bacillus]|uniref:DUF3243 family protein n=1 Tax=Bacillus TaxID=1386 RepID=UPI000BB8E227|nr:MULTISPECIES: DUF3243 family protein [Bacillus]